MCKECDDHAMNSRVCSGYPGIKFRCEACGQELKQAPPEPVDPKLETLKGIHERAKRAEEAALVAMDASRKDYDEAVDYRRRCQGAVEDYKRDLERRGDAAFVADFLERQAKNLREHPETYEDAKWSQEYPATVKEHQDGCCVGHTIERNDPCTTTIKLITWPQRKVAKEGEGK